MNYLLFVLALFGVVAFFKIAHERQWPLSWKSVSGKPPPWRDMSWRMRAFTVSVIAAWSVTMALMLTDGYIETAALSQPAVAEAQYRHPHMFKGVIRYLTDGQEQVYATVHPLMFGSWAILFVAGCLYARLVWQQSEKDRRSKLQRLIGDEHQPRDT
jgi:hypothetical protein